MDLDKVGKFIANNRKKKNLTQEELGHLLGVTGKTVSRWENGNYMPDISLLIPLSEELDISVNELLLGKKLDKKENEESLKYTINYSNNKIKKIKKNAIYVFIFLIILVTIFSSILIIAYKDVEKEIELCEKNENETCDSKEKFYYRSTLDDGRLVSYSINITYLENGKTKYLHDEIFNNNLSIDDFVSKLNLIKEFKDGGSKLYEYDKRKKYYGDEDFYVIVCNNISGDNNIYVSKYKETINEVCNERINDIEGVSMKIKDDTLTKTSATIVITDTSTRRNTYGLSYYIEKYIDGKWTIMEPKIEMIFNYPAYYVDKNHQLEFKIDWDTYYGSLDSGKYRIVKFFSDDGEAKEHKLTAEFTIE